MLSQYPKTFALLAGLLSATGFAPLNLWPVTLACLAVLLHLIARAPNLRGALARGYWFGAGHFMVGLNWIAHAFTFQDTMPHWFGYGAVFLLSLYLAVYPAMAAGLAWWGNKRLGGDAQLTLVLLMAASWIITEYLRAVLFTGFAWNPMGAIWLPTGVAQSAQVIGTYGLSGLAVLTGGALALLAERQWRAGGGVVVAVLILGIIGSLTGHATPDKQGQAIRVVQPNIPQDEKYGDGAELRSFGKLASLSGTPAENRSRLVFWPEAAIEAFLDMEPEWRSRLASVLGPRDLLLTGGVKLHYKSERKGFYVENTLIGARNSLWVLTPDARLTARYDKAHLVPYGEYLPMRQVLEPLGLSRLVPGDTDFWPGPGPQTLILPAGPGRPPLKMGVQICYEIIFSGQVVDAANRPDFLFNPSNDAWFGSWGPPQHLAQARLRAIEEGIPVIRSTPTGISAVVAANGRILNAIPHQTAGYIDTVLPPAKAPTLFSRIGNGMPFGLALLLLCWAIAICKRTRYGT